MIEKYLGIDPEYILIGVAAFALILLIIIIVQAAKLNSLKKKVPDIYEREERRIARETSYRKAG